MSQLELAIKAWLQEHHPKLLKGRTVVTKKVNKAGKQISEERTEDNLTLAFLIDNVRSNKIELLSSGRVLISLTRHESVCDLDAIKAHMNGKAYNRALNASNIQDVDWSVYEPHISPHKSLPNVLFCTLTGVNLNKNKQIVEKHMAGAAFQRALGAVNQFEAAKAEKRRKAAEQYQARQLLKQRFLTAGTSEDKYDFSQMDLGSMISDDEDDDDEDMEFDDDEDMEFEDAHAPIAVKPGSKIKHGDDFGISVLDLSKKSDKTQQKMDAVLSKAEKRAIAQKDAALVLAQKSQTTASSKSQKQPHKPAMTAQYSEEEEDEDFFDEDEDFFDEDDEFDFSDGEFDGEGEFDFGEGEFDSDSENDLLGIYKNGEFIPGITDDDGQFVPGILNDDSQFVPGIFNDDGEFTPGMFQDDQFVPFAMLGEGDDEDDEDAEFDYDNDEDAEFDYDDEDDELPPGKFDDNGEYIPGITHDDGEFIPGIFDGEGEFEPGMFQDGVFIPFAFLGEGEEGDYDNFYAEGEEDFDEDDVDMREYYAEYEDEDEDDFDVDVYDEDGEVFTPPPQPPQATKGKGQQSKLDGLLGQMLTAKRELDKPKPASKPAPAPPAPAAKRPNNVAEVVTKKQKIDVSPPTHSVTKKDTKQSNKNPLVQLPPPKQAAKQQTTAQQLPPPKQQKQPQQPQSKPHDSKQQKNQQQQQNAKQNNNKKKH